MLYTIGLLAAFVAAPLELPVLWQDTAGLRVDSRAAVWLPTLPAPDANGVIALSEPTRTADDPDAPADAVPPLVRYDFLVPAAAEYVVWLRVAPTADKNRLAEILDGRRYTGPAMVESTAADRSPRWLERPRIKVGAGPHRLVLAVDGYTMPRILAVVLQPVGAAPPDGEPPAGIAAANRPIELVSLPLAPGARVDLPGATVDDAGRVHVILEATRPTVGPLTARADLPEVAVLSNGSLDLLLDRRTGDFLLLRDRVADRVIAGDLTPTPMLSLQFKRPGEAAWLQVDPRGRQPLRKKAQYSLGEWHLEPAGDRVEVVTPAVVELAASGATIRHRFDVEGVGTAVATQSITPCERGWNLTASVMVEAGPADVVGVEYPRLPQVRLGASGWDDVQLRMMSFGHRAVVPGHATVHDASYCGRVVMNWTQLYDGDASLYLAAHDPAANTTVHQSDPAGSGGDTCGLSLRRCDAIAAGETAVWPTVIQVGGAGWHQGARTYGDWFDSVHGHADYPDWLRASPGWLDLQAENYGKGFSFATLPDWLTRAKAIGFDWVQVWGQFGYDGGPCCCAWYGPAPQYGGVAGWQAAASEIKRRGGHLGGYFIYDRVDRLPVHLDNFLGHYDRADYPPGVPWDTAAQQHALMTIEDPAGTVPDLMPAEAELADWRAKIDEHRKLYEGGQRAAPVQWWRGVWIDSPAWRDYLAGWVADRYVGEWGANTAYIDVMGTGNADLDYDPRRGHNGDGGWGLGRLKLAAELVRRGRAHDPSFGLTQEGLGDLPGRWAAAMCSGVYRGERNVVRYTFPDRILLHGMANSGGSGTGSAWSRFLATYREAMRWDVVGGPTALPVNLLNLSRPLMPELYQARFRDTEGLRVSDAAVEVRRLDATGTPLGATIVTVTNPEFRTATLSLDGEAAAAFEIALDGSVRAAPTGDLPVSTQAASVWIVVSRARTGAPVWPVLTFDRPGQALVLHLLNLSGQAVSGTAKLANLGYTDPYQDRLAEATATLGNGGEQRYSIAVGQVAMLRFPLPDRCEPAWTTRFRISLPGLDREALITPLVLDPGFELFEKSPGPGEGGGGALQLGPTTEGFQHRLVDLWLLPRRRYRLTMSSRRTGFEAAVRGVLLRLHHGEDEAYLDQRWSLDTKQPNAWQRIGGEFTTPDDLTRAALYLYNVRSPDTAWFDNLDLLELGPAE